MYECAIPRLAVDSYVFCILKFGFVDLHDSCHLNVVRLEWVVYLVVALSDPSVVCGLKITWQSSASWY